MLRETVGLTALGWNIFAAAGYMLAIGRWYAPRILLRRAASCTTTRKATTCSAVTTRRRKEGEMVTLVVATTTDAASLGPASALLAMPGWLPGPSLQEIPSFKHGEVRLLKHDNSIISEDHLDKRWEELTGEVVEEAIFLSKHTAVSNRPSLTVHPIGVPHLRDDEVPPQGGKPGWAAPPSPRIGPWLRLLKTIAQSQNLIPEFEVSSHFISTGLLCSPDFFFP
ncbi:D-aminoacyl-tRNA deacylase [Vitis vinifera]|uniref:D-aminoacyl-tRNA deacylase n=1 Tax=Vitis vinifera TaxID=29760 RepID=A0A438CBL8_VITVI|nr:D-aminoacyl-tRNA deacylase [Vitis vinifera]